MIWLILLVVLQPRALVLSKDFFQKISISCLTPHSCNTDIKSDRYQPSIHIFKQTLWILKRMNRFPSRFSLLTLVFTLLQLQQITSFSLIPSKRGYQRTTIMTTQMSTCDMSGHPSTLPGDPSLNLVTNVDLGDKKLDIMKG